MIWIKTALSLAGSVGGNSADVRIEKPAHRATSFTPRLGKRESIEPIEYVDYNKSFCSNPGIDCDRLMAILASNGNNNQKESALIALLLKAVSQNNNISNNQQQQQQISNFRQLQNINNAASDSELLRSDQLDLLDIMAEQLRRETRASEEIQAQNAYNDVFKNNGIGSGNIRNIVGVKRIPFTPRIG